MGLGSDGFDTKNKWSKNITPTIFSVVVVRCVNFCWFNSIILAAGMVYRKPSIIDLLILSAVLLWMSVDGRSFGLQKELRKCCSVHEKCMWDDASHVDSLFRRFAYISYIEHLSTYYYHSVHISIAIVYLKDMPMCSFMYICLHNIVWTKLFFVTYM